MFKLVKFQFKSAKIGLYGAENPPIGQILVVMT